MTEGIEGLTARLTALDALEEALETVLEMLRPYAGVDTPVKELVRFLPEDGSLSGLLRSLSPAIDLGDAIRTAASRPPRLDHCCGGHDGRGNRCGGAEQMP